MRQTAAIFGLTAALALNITLGVEAAAKKTKLFVLAWSAEAGEVQATKKVYERFMQLNPNIDVTVSMNTGNYWEKVHKWF
jgi:ABC-type glycerol-3-phosphate transport system substrate-binding protein